MNRVIVKLKVPIVVGENGTPITELSFRTEVVTGDLRGIKMVALNDPSVDDVLKIAGRLAGQPDVVMNRLCTADFDAVCRVIGPFLNPGQETGSEPSPS